MANQLSFAGRDLLDKDNKLKIASTLYKKVDAINSVNSLIQSKGVMSMGKILPYYRVICSLHWVNSRKSYKDNLEPI